MVKLCILGTGSKGNATYLDINGYEILIDAGFSYKELKKRMAVIGKDIQNIKAVFFSHFHTDHTQALLMFHKKKDVKIYTAIDQEINLNKSIKIIPFSLSHDVPCLGFRVESLDFSLVYALDTGCISEEALKHMFGATVVLIETNYDLATLTENQKYPTELIERIDSDEGHLCNEDAARVLGHITHDKLKMVIGMHGSAMNNRPELAEYEIKTALKDKAVDVLIAGQIEPSKLVCFL